MNIEHIRLNVERDNDDVLSRLPSGLRAHVWNSEFVHRIRLRARMRIAYS